MFQNARNVVINGGDFTVVTKYKSKGMTGA